METAYNQTTIKVGGSKLSPDFNLFSFEMCFITKNKLTNKEYTTRINHQMFADIESAKRYKDAVMDNYHKKYPDYKVLESHSFYSGESIPKCVDMVLEERDDLAFPQLKSIKTKFSVRRVDVYDLNGLDISDLDIGGAFIEQ